MHENNYRPEEQEWEQSRNNRLQQNFEEEMEEMFMDLRFFVC